jgi:cell division transport system permease protein
MKVPSASARASRSDELGLRRALAGGMLPPLVAAMALLAALSMAGWVGSTTLSRQWQEGAGSALTVQVPRPIEPAAKAEGSRLTAAVALLTATPGVASVHVLTDAELADLLRPWLGSGADRLAIPLPAVVAVRLTGESIDLRPLGRDLDEAAPGTIVEDHGLWMRRLAALAFSMRACALVALVLVCAVAAAVIGVATRAGLAARREAIEIVHGLGATDGFIAGRFARRTMLLTAAGGLIGAAIAVPALLALAELAAPFADTPRELASVADVFSVFPTGLWGGTAALPFVAAAIGFCTAQWTVRRWLRHLP